MSDFSLNRFIFGDLDPQKRWLVQRLIFQSFFTGLASAYFFVSAYGVMLKNLPINELPFAYLSSGLGGILLLKLFQKVQRDYGASFAQRFTIFAFCALMLLLYYLNFSEGHFIDKKIVAVLGFTFIIPFGNIFTLNISTSCFQILGIQTGKKWLAKLGAGETIAAIFAFLTAPTFIDLFGASELFLVAGVAIIPLLFLSVLGYIRTTGSKSTYSLSNKISVQSLWNMPFFRLIIISTSISVIVLYWVDYTYLISVKSIAKLNGWKTSEIVSVFFALVKSGELLGSLLSASLIKQLGTQKSLRMFSIVLFVPTIVTVSLYYVFGANVVTLFFFVLSLKWFERVFRRAVDVPANRIMLQVAKPEEKVGLQTALEGMVGQIATVIGGAYLLFLANGVDDVNALKIGFVMKVVVSVAAIVLFWIFIVKNAAKLYQKRLANFLHDASQKVDLATDITKGNSSTTEIVFQPLNSKEVIKKLWLPSLVNQIEAVKRIDESFLNYEDILEMGLAAPLLLKSEVLSKNKQQDTALSEKLETKHNVMLMNLGESLVWVDLTIDDIKGRTLTEYYLYLSLIQTRKLLINQLFTLLAWQYSPREMQIISKLIYNSEADDDDSQFAMELLDTILPPLIKPYLLPVFENNTIEKKIEMWRQFIPANRFSSDERLKDIAMRDFSQLPISVKFWALRVLNLRKVHSEYLLSFDTSTMNCLRAAVSPKVSTLGNLIEVFEKSLDYKNTKETFAKTELFCDWLNQLENKKGVKITKADFENYIDMHLDKLMPFTLS